MRMVLQLVVLLFKVLIVWQIYVINLLVIIVYCIYIKRTVCIRFGDSVNGNKG